MKEELPVIACKQCLSLGIKRGYPDYCDNCGSTILIDDKDYFISDWKVDYKTMYGKDFIDV